MAAHQAISFLLNFNSTMVRLREGKGTYYYLNQPQFQFHYGTIEGWIRKWAGVSEMYFNSTMVRLRDASRMGEFVSTLFQFHYGTIEGM